MSNETNLDDVPRIQRIRLPLFFNGNIPHERTDRM